MNRHFFLISILVFLISFLLSLTEAKWVKPETCECEEGYKILPNYTCPHWETEQMKLRDLKKFPRGTPERRKYRKIISDLLSLVCTQKPEITLCCPQPASSPVTAGKY